VRLEAGSVSQRQAARWPPVGSAPRRGGHRHRSASSSSRSRSWSSASRRLPRCLRVKDLEQGQHRGEAVFDVRRSVRV